MTLFIITAVNYSQPLTDVNKINADKDIIRKSGIKSKTVWEYHYSQQDENAFKDSYKALNYYYDNLGRATEFTKYHIYSNLTVKELYSYGKNDNIIGTKRYNSADDMIESIEYKYNKTGQLRKETHTAYLNQIRPNVYFTIIANVSDDSVFGRLQDELGIEPRLSSYTITVNITDTEELNQYVVIGDEADVTSPRFTWSELSMESQRGLLAYNGPNKKEHTYIKKYISDINYRYDSKGNRTSKVVYTTAGDVLEKEIYSYDASNNKTSYAKYNENDKSTGSELYLYDAGGRLTESVGKESDGRTASRLQYKYDNNGRLIEKIWLNAFGEVMGEYKYLYDNDGRLAEEIKYRSGNEKESRQVYKYDDKENIIEITKYNINDKKDKLIKYLYEFY